MRFSWLPWLVASALLFGCGDDDSQAGGNGAGGAPGSGGGGEVVPDPILEREPAISYDCTEERPMASETGAMNARLEGLVALDGEFFVTTVAETLDIAKVELDGSVGTPVPLVSEPYAASASITTSDGTDLVTVWTQGGELRFARIDSALQIIDGPAIIPGTAASAVSVSAAALLPTESGFTLLYGTYTGSAMELRFLQLGPDGQPIGSSELVAEVGEVYAASASVTATGDGGFAVAYAGGDAGESSVWFVVLNANGAPRFAPKRISQAPGGDLSSGYSYTPRRNIVKVGDAYWVTFTESVTDYERHEGSTIVRVAVVDAEGNAMIHALEAPVDQVDNHYSTFVEVGDGIGLAWTTGAVIWECGGCITDYDMHFVMLDTQTLVPASQVVTHLHQSNGITTPIVAVDGDELLTGANLDFHALTIPATGAIRCVPAE